MSKYMPKVGDRVRATLGENVLVGVIHMRSTENAWWQIEADGVVDVDPFVLSANDGWWFEQVVEVPTKFGAVIRKPEGDVWVHHGDGEWYDVEGCECTNADVERGGFTVLFEGVDE